MKRVLQNLVLCFLCAVMLCSCVTVKSPPLEEVYDRAVALIEASAEINEIFFGRGLPTTDFEAAYQTWKEGDGKDRDDVTLEEYIRLFDTDGYYTPVLSNTYLSTDDIKAAAEQVYSKDYLEQVYESAFEGFVNENGTVNARYWDGPEGLMMLKEADVWVEARRVYDYSTMTMGRSDRKDHFYIEIMSHLEGEDEMLEVRLGFVLQDGVWMLDSPTY